MTMMRYLSFSFTVVSLGNGVSLELEFFLYTFKLYVVLAHQYLTWEAIYKKKIINGYISNGFLRKGSNLQGFPSNASPEIGDGLMH